MVLDLYSYSIVNIIGREQVDKERCHTVPSVEALSKLPIQIIERVRARETSEEWRGTITYLQNIPLIVPELST